MSSKIKYQLLKKKQKTVATDENILPPAIPSIVIAAKKKQNKKKATCVKKPQLRKSAPKKKSKTVDKDVKADSYGDCQTCSSPTLDPIVNIAVLPLLDELDELIIPPHEYEKSPQLLLTYTYFINDAKNKYISVGFSTPDIVPVVVLCHIGECSITLTAHEWFSLFLYIAEIEDMFDKSLFMESKYLSHETSIVHDVTLGQIILIKEKVLLKLDKADWTSIVNLADYFRSVINYFTQSAYAVKSYYDMYLQSCKENNFLYLETTNFFKPSNDICNYFRLFHEISFILKNKISK